jgi:putative oxidoreductase
MFARIFAPGNDSTAASLALLSLRVWLGLTLLINHGIGKLKAFDSMAPGFADPFKIGHTASFTLVVFAEVVAAALLAAGLVTRFAAFVLVISMSVAFFYVHKGSLSGGHSGELAFIYLAGFVALLLAGPGQFSADKRLFGAGRGGASKKSKSSDR